MLKIGRFIRKKYSEYIFSSRAICGDNLQLSEDTRCFVPSKGQLVIGDNCDLAGCRIYVIGDGKVKIGSYTTIRYNSKISAVDFVSIGTHVIISNNVDIYDHNSHPTSPKVRWEMCEGGFYGANWSPEKAVKKATVIEDGVWIGEKTTILKGVRIGEGSIVASCSVAGNPAKVVKYLCERI